jgi:iron complex transport system ATP-binding protein
MPAETALELKHVTAGYRHAPVIRDVSFALPQGCIAALIGPNGAGKTTLLRAITGLLPPLAGSLQLFGTDVSRLSPAERARLVGVVPQDMEVPMAFTVGEIVMMGRTAAIRPWHAPSAEDRRMVERAMAYTDVIDLKDRRFTEMSGGERQRAVIAMVLAQQPRIILMDEPTSHLDMNHRMEVMQIVERMNREQGVTVLIVSHDLNLAAEFCSRLLLVDGGTLAADGTPQEVLTEDQLRRVYHCDVRVQVSPASGAVLVLPAPRPAATHTGRGIHIHVIAGGGCGEEILRRLLLQDYTLTCGVVNEGDSDAIAAAAMGIPAALEKPFSPMGAAALAQARTMVARCDAVVVSAVPFGPGNCANLELAGDARRLNKPVFLMDGIATRDYTPTRAAAALAARLAADGAQTCRDVAHLASCLPARRA